MVVHDLSIMRYRLERKMTFGGIYQNVKIVLGQNTNKKDAKKKAICSINGFLCVKIYTLVALKDKARINGFWIFIDN